MFSNLGAPIPLPNLQVGARVGLTEEVDVDGNVSLLGPAYGVVALDVGAVGQIVREPHGLAISASARGHLVVGLRGPDARFYPELGLHLEGVPAPWLGVYGGLITMAQLDPPEGKPGLFAAPYGGVELRFGGDDALGHPHGIALEAGWISPWQDSTSVISWQPANLGALYVHLGFRTRFDTDLAR